MTGWLSVPPAPPSPPPRPSPSSSPPHLPRPYFIRFFLRLEIAIALRIKPGLGSLAANGTKGWWGLKGWKKRWREEVWEVEGGGGRGSHNDDARYSKKKEENISLPRTVMNEKAEGRLISFFRFNKSLPPAAPISPYTFYCYDFIPDGSRTSGRLVSSSPTADTRVALHSRRKKGAAS